MPSPSKSKRQRVDLTWAEKRKICEVHSTSPSLTHSELAQYMVDHHNFRLVSRSAVTKILEESGRWLEVSPANIREGRTKRVREAKWPKVEKALMLWCSQIWAKKRGTVNDATLVEKATEFRDAFHISEAEFKISHGWLEKFKSRHGIDGGSVGADAHAVGVSHARLPGVIAKYDPEDVFNFAEVGLYYRAAPFEGMNGMMTTTKKKTDRVTLGLCVNVSGKERLKVMFIHTRTRPRHLPAAFDPEVVVHYFSSRNAWMNGEVFTRWIVGENRRMSEKGRSVLILSDGAASHSVAGVQKTKISDFDAVVLSNITLLFFPANVSAVVQPLDQGVATALKSRYKRRLLAWSLDQPFRAPSRDKARDFGALPVDLLQCMIWIVAAWNELDSETIQNAWRLSEILPQSWNTDSTDLQEKVKQQVDDEITELQNLITAWDLAKTGGAGGEPAQILAASEYVNMVDEGDVGAEYDTIQIVELVENGFYLDSTIAGGNERQEEEGNEEEQEDGRIDLSDAVNMAVGLGEARVCGQKLLEFMLSQGSERFGCNELLQMERICYKISRMGLHL